MKYRFNTKFIKGDIIFFHTEKGIKSSPVTGVHATLRDDASAVVFYTVNSDKTKYRKQAIDVIEESLAFATPEEVAASLVEKFKSGLETKVVTVDESTQDDQKA